MQVAHAEGPAGFYRGFGAVLAGVVPATMVYYAAYETSKKLLPEEWGALKGPAVGLMTQLAAGLAFTPVDIIKERMQVGKPNNFWLSALAHMLLLQIYGGPPSAWPKSRCRLVI